MIRIAITITVMITIMINLLALQEDGDTEESDLLLLTATHKLWQLQKTCQVAISFKVNTHLIVHIISIYYTFYGYSRWQALFASYFDCYWGCTITSKKFVATTKLNNVIVISQHNTTIAGRIAATSPLPGLNLLNKRKVVLGNCA